MKLILMSPKIRAALRHNDCKQIKAAISAETNLTATAGVSFNKFLAKMASGKQAEWTDDFARTRPDFVEALPIEKFQYWTSTATKMHNLGICCGADSSNSVADLVQHFFGKVGHFYYKIAGQRMSGW